MSIPQNIQRQHLLSAINKIDQEGVPDQADSKFYDVLYKGERYPPKLLISYGNLFANGIILDRNSFEGGKGTKCFKLLEKNDFVIVEKKAQSYANVIRKFLNQSKTGSLETSSYDSKFLGLNVKVSFGKGNQARVPWIAFLKPPNDVSNGIYPVYLNFKSNNKLILAYGVSETVKPNVHWSIEDSYLISEYFKNEKLGKPERYGQSMVFKAYDSENLPNDEILQGDLDTILQKYSKMRFDIVGNEEQAHSKTGNKKFDKIEFDTFLVKAGLLLHPSFTLRFIASVITKPFLILTGLSGSGKTKLAQAFAEWISENEDQIALIPVGADWTNREPLLGYVNGLEIDKYVTESEALDLILRANSNPEKPYFLILDEMNLSHVERYFADFLSVMESGKDIKLHSSITEMSGVPSRVSLPKNLFIIGTVNIDETTYMFSPKVLDRANVIEFRVNEKEIKQFLSDLKPVDMNALKSKGASMGASFLGLSRNTTFEKQDSGKISEVLVLFFNSLSEIGAEFGYRSGSEIVRLINQLKVLDTSISTDHCLDIAIMQKLLPKLHGSRRKLVSVLKVLAQLCLKEEIKDIEKDVLAKSDFSLKDERVSYPISLEKIKRMYNNAIEHGFASYAEA